MNAQFDKQAIEPGWIGVLKAQVESLKFGTVQVVVHESRVVQIEKTEKLRLDKQTGPGEFRRPVTHLGT